MVCDAEKGEAIEYEDFINNLSIKDYYDANHVITVLSEAKIDELLKNIRWNYKRRNIYG